jgi:ATP-binding cassette subfamily B protein
MFSTVFQDIHFTASTGIIGNVSSTTPDNVDKQKFERSLQLSDIYEYVNSLPDRELTGIVRHADENGIELSGGQKQKIALARALYKDAPVIILDEPTAALDPISESRLYQHYAELTEGKTSIYISHRLASTRFCDRILLLDRHKIVEEGTHDELIALNGKYAEMFRIQSSYYAETEAQTA